ncbi:acyl-CoA N-acyltransferase [Pleomassaria siparia CBS 279.74]|uniref:Acyl-CoA N-acyltransferase n=1 Tax=Pleomassaria siparia CBS 279.74 TaxID=1314801 RepID=A0A6G1KAH1_9PLEO|nr:acyl-CoA N-acyltransferase [Pleomassaria siparia CBS 279.74]
MATSTPSAISPPSYTVRPYRTTDIPDIISGHRQSYVDEWGWNQHFISVVSGVLDSYECSHNPAKEHFWVAEHRITGDFLGCVMLIQKSSPPPPSSALESESESELQASTTARLRVLFVSTAARGMGLGRVLVRKTTEFAKEKGYETLQLTSCTWLGAAMRIYEQEGYRVVSEEENDMFGPMHKHVVLELDLKERTGNIGGEVKERKIGTVGT